MQDRYAGDVGDFGKFALLRALAPGRQLGICWYLTDGTREQNNDGRHLAYLDCPARFEQLDPDVFRALSDYRAAVQIGRCRRSVEALERLKLLPNTTLFHRGICPPPTGHRAAWAREMVSAMQGADLVLLDPDNGLAGASTGMSPKCVLLDELLALRAPGRALVLYQHQTRRRGGAAAEVGHLIERLGAAGFDAVHAVRLRPYSSRFYFLVDGDAALTTRLAAFAAHWGREVESFASAS